MKKTLFLAIAAIGTITTLSCTSTFAATPPDSCFALNAATGTITDYYDNEGNNSANPACPRDVDIPAKIGTVDVVAIASASNYWDPATATSFANKNLTSVTIPDSVTTIGNYAFASNQLTSVNFGDSVTTIGDGAFFNSQLTSVTLGDSVTTIGNSAFYFNHLTSVTLGDSVTTIGDYAFSQNQLTSVTIPDSVTAIGNSAFYFNQLTSVTLGDSVTAIGNSAFYFNQLTSVTLSDSVTAIGDYAFATNKLTSVTLGDSVTTIGDFAFANNQLTSVTIPDSVTTIGNYAFASNQLTSVNFGDSVTAIGNSAFYFNQLTSVTLGDSVTTIGNEAFAYNQLTSVTLGDSVTTIGNYAFASNQLTSVTLGSSVTSQPKDFIGWQGNPAAHDIMNNYDLRSLTPDERATYLANTWYVRVYTEDPANLRGFEDYADVLETADPDTSQPDGGFIIRSGILINPASTTVAYKNTAGTELSPSLTTVGTHQDGTTISDYTLANSPVLPVPVESWNPTPEESAAIQDALKAYIRLGSTHTFTAPSISGYSTITPSSPHTMTLASTNNTLNFIYSNLPPAVADVVVPTAGAVTGSLAATGVNSWILIVAAITVLFAGAFTIRIVRNK